MPSGIAFTDTWSLDQMRSLGMSYTKVCPMLGVSRSTFSKSKAKLGEFGFIYCLHCERALPLTSFWALTNRSTKVCRECSNAKLQSWRAANPEKQKAIQKRQLAKIKLNGYAKQKAYYREVKQQTVSAYGGKCYCCGESGLPFLTIDHPNNDGKADRALNRTVIWFRLRAKGFPTGYRLACFNCNCARQSWNRGGDCPHMDKKEG